MTAHAQTIDEFCRSHRISRGTFYNLLKQGRGPIVMKVGARTLISVEAGQRWRRAMELTPPTGRAEEQLETLRSSDSSPQVSASASMSGLDGEGLADSGSGGPPSSGNRLKNGLGNGTGCRGASIAGDRS